MLPGGKLIERYRIAAVCPIVLALLFREQFVHAGDPRFDSLIVEARCLSSW